MLYGIGWAEKNSQIKAVASGSVVGSPTSALTASPPGQACSPPRIL